MYKEIVIGEKTVPMMATALTPKLAYEFFNEDFLAAIGKEIESGKSIDMAAKIGFIMAKRAGDHDMKKLQPSDFEKWLDGFALGDIIEAAPDIIDLYLSSTKPNISPK